jgi:hypothetical protein
MPYGPPDILGDRRALNAADRQYAAAARKAATVLALAEGGHGSGDARLAVRLLDQATASQARRVTSASQSPDMSGHMQPYEPPADDEWPGQYL